MSNTNRANSVLLVLILAVGISIVAMLASGVRAGPLDPPGPPSASGTLPQVEPRMPIPPVGWNGTFPITISQRGSYFLTENLTDSTATTNGILITASHVVLDLNGFTLAGSSTGFNGVGADSSLTDITVRNGTVTGWTGNAGIGLDSSSDTVEEVRALGNGAGVEVGSGSAVSHVDAENNSGDGIGINDPTTLLRGGMIEDSVASKNGGSGIGVAANNVTVRNCSAEKNTIDGVFVLNAADVVEDNNIIGNASNGVGLSGSGGAVNHDSVVHNVFHGNTSGPVFDNGTSDVIGPFDTNATSSEPWSNLS